MKIIKKGEYLVREKQICRYVYFIEEGLVRQFVTIGNKEHTTWLLTVGDLVISVVSFFEQIPAEDNVVAIEDTTVYYISFEELEAACREYPEFAIIRDRIKTEYYGKKEKHDQQWGLLDARGRYEYFMEHHRDLIDRVNNDILASYLRMDLETLYEIRRKKKDGK